MVSHRQGLRCDDPLISDPQSMDSEPSCVVDALPGLVWTALANGHIEYLNRRWCEFTGLGVDELRGQAWQRTVHPDDLSQLLERWHAMLKSGKPGDMEARLRRFDGEYRWFAFRASPLIDESGEVLRWHGLNVDVEDRRRAEQRQRVREERFQLIVDGFPAIVSLRTPSGDLEHVNRRFMEYSGETLETLKAKPWHSTWHPDDRPAARVAWQAALDTGNPCDFEGRRRRADGTHRWFRMRAQPLHDSDGRIVLWYLLQTDIDDQRRAEALLASERLLLERLARGHPVAHVLEELCCQFESRSPGSVCGVVVVTRNGTSFEMGAAPSVPAPVMSSIVGRPIHGGAGPCAMAVHTNEQVIAADLASDRRWSEDVRAAMLLQGLQSCWATPITAATGNPIGALAIFHSAPSVPTPADLSVIEQFTQIAGIAIEREHSDDALGKAQSDLARVARVSSLGALTASIAHEVNQPLSGIVTNASTCLRMLAADPPNVDGARETARRTIRDGKRAADVISRLRALFTKKDATSELVNLNDAAREVIALLSRELQRSHVRLQAELADELPHVRGDRVQLQQVILNLLLNASEAMSSVNDRPRRLSIRTERDEGGGVRLEVEDAGIGVEANALDRLFDAFYTTKTGGMGIGLSISRSIVESHQGRLWATPNAGPGTTFTLFLPAEPGSAQATPDLQTAKRPATKDAAHAAASP